MRYRFSVLNIGSEYRNAGLKESDDALRNYNNERIVVDINDDLSR